MFVDEARWVISNTGDRGYELDPADRLDGPVPRSFPAKLTKLLVARHGPQANYNVQLRRTRYDSKAVIDHTLASGVPHAEWWTDCWEPEP